MNTTARRNIRPWDEMDQEARNYRAQHEAGNYEVTPHDGSLLVEKIDGSTAYLVSQHSCTCDDFTYRASRGDGRACKHMRMAGNWLLEQGLSWEGEVLAPPVSCVRPRTAPAPGPAGPEELARPLPVRDLDAEDALFDRLYG